MCRNPIVDSLISEPCEILTTPDGYTLTSEGNRVLRCLTVKQLQPYYLSSIRAKIRKENLIRLYEK